jgi:alkanesulfonate monooxygenase SsuD/methylene tetrahydromethanopterin reductase-like flavin-dependent oxidoreductase (luciferase family)
MVRVGNGPRSESRGRIQKAPDIVRLALTSERLTYEGEFYTLAETQTRTRPRNGPGIGNRLPNAVVEAPS